MHRVYHVLASQRLGGAAAISIRISERLHAGGRLGGMFVPGDGPAMNSIRSLGMPVGTYPYQQIVAPGRMRALCGNLRLGARLKSWRRGIVHFHLPVLYRATRYGLGRCASVVHVHIEEPPDSFQWAFRNPPDVVVTCAKFLVPLVRNSLPREIQESQRIEAIPNAVDIDRFAQPEVDNARQAAKHLLKAPVDRPIVLMMANLAPHKGQATAIRAVARLKALGVKADCWLAGEDREGAGYERELANLARQEGVGEEVKLLGFRADVEQLYAAADVLLLPSKNEGLPLTILEAQAAKVPVVASPTAGIPEIVEHGRTGWLAPPDDWEGYATHIRSILENQELARDIARQAYENVRSRHSWDMLCNKVLAIYDSLAA